VALKRQNLVSAGGTSRRPHACLMWPTVLHETGAESLDFDEELCRIFAPPLSEPSEHRVPHSPFTDCIILKCFELYGYQWTRMCNILGKPFTEDDCRARFLRICQHVTLSSDVYLQVDACLSPVR
jgi:hypothetical protein